MFPAGLTEAIFNISLIDDDILEVTETFILIINPSSLPNNVTIGELGEAAVTILDNDGEFLISWMAFSLFSHVCANQIHLDEFIPSQKCYTYKSEKYFSSIVRLVLVNSFCEKLQTVMISNLQYYCTVE